MKNCVIYSALGARLFEHNVLPPHDADCILLIRYYCFDKFDILYCAFLRLVMSMNSEVRGMFTRLAARSRRRKIQISREVPR